MAETTRCFIAIDFSREIIKEIERIQEEIKKKNLMVGKFTERENLHLTLKFLGEIDSNQLKEVKKKLKEIKFSKFLAYIGDLGVFSSNYIKIVWVQILGKSVIDLQKEIDLKLNGLFKLEERFMSHLTIARVKRVKDKNLFLEALKEVKVKNLSSEVPCFYLIKSELKDFGPEYTVLEKYDLT
jgi:2'-5' RNA ligase